MFGEPVSCIVTYNNIRVNFSANSEHTQEAVT